MTTSKLVLGLGAGYLSTMAFITARKYYMEKFATEEDMRTDIELILAMHKDNSMWLKKSLNKLYGEICDSKTEKKVKIYALNYISAELAKIEESEKCNSDLDDCLKDLDKALDNMREAIKNIG